MHPLAIITASALLVAAARGEDTFRSTAQRTHLLELFTSEGCSSCPPAEAWLSSLRTSPRLWKDFVPVAFHVDYWDGLGWPDRFASKSFTARQRTYAAAWGNGSIYTPAFVLDGREWRGRSLEAIPSAREAAGVLVATVGKDGTVSVTFDAKGAGPWTVHAAVLGFGVSSKIKAGENRGRQSTHDFVVLGSETAALTASSDGWRAKLTLPALRERGELGLAVWVAERGQTRPVQAVGGKL